jgi:outer membrane receptor protein involved in Fe transport
VVIAFDPFTLLRENVGSLRSRGIALIANASLGRGWTAEAGFVYTDAEITGSSDP